jgi:DNA-binding NarL/FixJ family response regulator
MRIITKQERQYLSKKQFHSSLPLPTPFRLMHIKLLAMGWKASEIAAWRGILDKNARDIILRLQRRYKCFSHAHLVATAIRAGWLKSYQYDPNNIPTLMVKHNYPFSSNHKHIILLLASGYSLAEIAQKRTVMMHTVKVHLYRMYKRYHVRNAAQLVAFAFRQGWID